MKKTKIFAIFASLFVMLGATVLYSCSSTTNETAPNKAISVRNNKSTSSPLRSLTYHRAGEIHNALLSEFKRTANLPQNYGSNESIAQNIENNVCASIQRLEGWECNELPTSSKKLLEEMLNNNFHINVENGWKYYVERSEPFLSEREKDIIEQARVVLFGNFSGMTKQQVSQTIQTGIDQLISVHNSITWNDQVGEGRMSGGLLQVIKHSISYWEQPVNEGPNPDTPEAQWLTAAIDAIGFIGGFANNCWTNGNWGSWSAVGSGIILGATASCIRYITVIGVK